MSKIQKPAIGYDNSGLNKIVSTASGYGCKNTNNLGKKYKLFFREEARIHD